MYKIEKSKYIQKVLLCFVWIGCFLLISFGFFLGCDMTLFSILMYIVSLISLSLLYFIIYLILRRFSKIIFSFDSNRIEFTNHGNIEKIIQVCDISKMFYVRTIWMLLSQMGASYLMIEYLKDKEIVKEYISMSKNDAKNIEKILGIPIEIK